ncbi:MAG: peptide chain release factor 2 [bacterium]
MKDDIKLHINQIKEKAKNLFQLLNIQEKKKQLGEMEKQSADPQLWQDQNKAKKVMQDKKYLENEINSYELLVNGVEDAGTFLDMAGDDDLAEIQREVAEMSKTADKLELAALLSGEYDKSNAILSINAGAGGTDAQDWAQIMLRMYTRWAEAKEYKVEMPDISYGDEAGIKGVTLMISGPYAYGYLRTEGGIHRLVRMSPFNSDGKRHTSFAAVEVIPEMSDEINIDINPADLRVDTYRASGPGGQHVNKTDSAVRLTHIPTGLVTQCQSERSQTQNKESAMKLLKAKLYEMMLQQKKEKIDELRGEKKKIEWGSQIRSYVFQPYTMVKDHRTKAENTNVQAVIDGDLDRFIEASLRS